MGKGRDKKKKAAVKAGKIVVGKGAAKTDSKTHKNEKKKTRRKMFNEGVGGDEVEKILSSIEVDQVADAEATIEPIPPTPRINFSSVTVIIRNSYAASLGRPPPPIMVHTILFNTPSTFSSAQLRSAHGCRGSYTHRLGRKRSPR
eukprot:SAG11_NODE_290_length_11190_cov_12.004872_5_plen_145_part_00